MTTLSEHIRDLQKLEAANPENGNLPVYYRHGASGDCGPLSSAHVTDEIDEETGPFDIDTGDKYVSIYAGN
jgi:hypothetical protein